MRSLSVILAKILVCSHIGYKDDRSVTATVAHFNSLGHAYSSIDNKTGLLDKLIVSLSIPIDL